MHLQLSDNSELKLLWLIKKVEDVSRILRVLEPLKTIREKSKRRRRHFVVLGRLKWSVA